MSTILGRTMATLEPQHSFRFAREMKLQPGLITVRQADLASYVQKAQEERVPVYMLPRTGIVDRASFFDALRAPPCLRTLRSKALEVGTRCPTPFGEA